MDQFVLDLGDDPAAAGDEVVLFGAGERRRADRAGLGRGDRHDHLRDRHPDRPAGAARLRRRGRSAGEPRERVPAWGKRAAVGRRRGRRRRGGRRGRPGGRAVRRRPVVPQRARPRRATSRSASCAATVVHGHRRRRRALHVEVDGWPAGPPYAPVTVVFCHGLALNQDSWHYQRRDLAASSTTCGWSSATSAATAGPARGDAEHATIDQLGATSTRVIEADRARAARSSWSATRWAA